MQNKNLEYYINLEYDLIVRRIKDEIEVVYKAITRELNPDVFYGVGTSVQAAVEELENAKVDMFSYYLENGIPIAEPQPQSEDLPSGNFVIRTTPLTHKKLIELAKANRQSLNATVNKILSEYVTSESLIEAVSSRLGDILVGTSSQRTHGGPGSRTWSTSANYEVHGCQSSQSEVIDVIKYIEQDKREVAAS